VIAPRSLGRGPRRSHRTGGQALVEFTVVVPVFLLLLTGMMEFGFAFSDRLTLGNATREGARVGASLVTGSTTTCTGDPNGVDTQIVASMQNILKSGGSDVNLARVTNIKIYKATSTGGMSSGKINTWTYTPGSGPDADTGPGVERLDFSPSSSGWTACSRSNASSNPDSLGVSITYQYQLQTPLAGIMALLGRTQAATITLVDTTVMALNPTS
jgi:Flp pilus assembly protein TadG